MDTEVDWGLAVAGSDQAAAGSEGLGMVVAALAARGRVVAGEEEMDSVAAELVGWDQEAAGSADWGSVEGDWEDGGSAVGAMEGSVMGEAAWEAPGMAGSDSVDAADSVAEP